MIVMRMTDREGIERDENYFESMNNSMYCRIDGGSLQFPFALTSQGKC